PEPPPVGQDNASFACQFRRGGDGAALLSCYSDSTIFTCWRNGRAAPIFYEESQMASVYEKEHELEREITVRIGESLPGVEVLAVELTGPERFTVFVDRAEGVDHALCEQVTRVLWDY